MNATIGLTQAKARFSELVDRVETGERVVISRNGVPVAELRAIKRDSVEDVVARIRALRRRIAKRSARREARA